MDDALASFHNRVRIELRGCVVPEPPMTIISPNGKRTRWTGFRVLRRGCDIALLSTGQCRRLAKVKDLDSAISRASKRAA